MIPSSASQEKGERGGKIEKKRGSEKEAEKERGRDGKIEQREGEKETEKDLRNRDKTE